MTDKNEMTSGGASQIETLNQKLANQEHDWFRLIEGASDGVWDWHLSASRIYYSNRWKASLGYEPDEIDDVFEEFTSRLHPEDSQCVQQAIIDYVNGSSSYYSAEFRIRAKDGGYRWIIDRGICVERDDKGKPTRIIGFYTDVTAIHEARETIRQQQEKLQLAVNYGGVGLWEADLDAQVITVSESLLKQIHDDSRQTVRSYDQWSELFPENDWEIAMDEINDCIRGHRLEFSTSYRMRTADGHYRWFQANGTPIRDASGRITRIIGAAVDITNQKASEQQLLRLFERARKERDRTVLAQKMARVGLWESDIGRQDIACDAVYASMLGYQAEPRTITFAESSEGMVDGDWEKVSSEVNSCLRGETEEFEVTYRRRQKDGTIRHYLSRGKAVRTPSGKALGVLGASIDVTESEERYAELAEQERFYRSFIEQLPAGAALIQDERIFINKAVEKITGYDRSKLNTLDDWFRLLHPGKAQGMRRYYETERDVHPARRGEITITTRTGQTKQVRFAAYCQSGMDIWVLRDITHGSRVDRLMRQNEQISGSGGWELDCASGELYWTDGMYRLHETTRSETKITHERAIGFFTAEHQSMVRAAIEEARLNGKPWDFIAEKVTVRGNRFWIRSIGLPEIEGGQVVRIFGSVMDITAQHRSSQAGHNHHAPLRLAGGLETVTESINARRQ
ncbi:MAG: PAS domain-containing protein [Anaerolineae bacterium]|nr:PAS domain-containing protein [Anaerolineae bacterium]